MTERLLTGVTIAGVDETVAPEDLARISAQWPFVEWGILLRNKGPKPRYPGIPWLRDFANAMARVRAARVALHLCGELSRLAMAGYPLEEIMYDAAVLLPLTSRIQLNGFSDFRLPALRLLEKHRGLEVIAQCHELVAFSEAAALLKRHEQPRLSVLYDPSGGRGVYSPDYANTLATAMHFLRGDGFAGFGLAGGMNKKTIGPALAVLNQAGVPYWIDLESGARDPATDAIDLDAVHGIIALATDHIRQEAPP